MEDSNKIFLFSLFRLSVKKTYMRTYNLCYFIHGEMETEKLNGLSLGMEISKMTQTVTEIRTSQICNVFPHFSDLN